MSGFETFFPGAVWNVVAWALVHFVWQGALIAVLLGTALAVLPRRWSGVRFLMAAGAMGLMIVAPLMTGAYLSSGAGSGQTTTPHAALSSVPVEVVERAATPGDSSPRAGFLSEVGLQSRVLEPWLPVILVLWLTGVGALSLRNFGGLIAVRRLSRDGTFSPPLEWEAVLARLVRRLGVMQSVRLLGSNRVSVPTVVGWLRPVILVPGSAFTGLHPRELEAILAHELAHVRRFDYLVNLVQTFVETLLFYHPAVWWVSRQVRLERENCCDDIAVAACGDVRVYAEALTRMETLRSLAPDLAMGADGGSLRSRIVRLVGARTVNRGRSDRWIPGTLTLLAATILGLVYLSTDAPQTGAKVVEDAKKGSRVSAKPSPGYSFSYEVGPDDRLAAYVHEQARADYEAAVELAEQASENKSRNWSVASDAYARAQEAYEGALAMAARESERGSRAWSGRSSNQGEWEARYEDDHIWFNFRWDRSNWNSHMDISELGLSRAQVEGLLDGPTIDFEYPREAGVFVFEGSTENRRGRTEASGTFVFKPDPRYVEAMGDLGYDHDDVERRQMELAAHDVTTAYVRDLAGLGYDDVPLSRVIEFNIHGVDIEFVRGIVGSGYDDIPPSRLVEFRIHGIDPEYVREIVDAGYGDLPAQKMIEFRIHGVDPEYVREMVNAGYGNLTPQKMIEFRIHGVDPEYAQDLADLGYADLPPQRLIEMRIHGVSPESVRDLQERGLDELSVEELIELHIHGLDRVLKKKDR